MARLCLTSTTTVCFPITYFLPMKLLWAFSFSFSSLAPRVSILPNIFFMSAITTHLDTSHCTWSQGNAPKCHSLLCVGLGKSLSRQQLYHKSAQARLSQTVSVSQQPLHCTRQLTQASEDDKQ